MQNNTIMLFEAFPTESNNYERTKQQRS